MRCRVPLTHASLSRGLAIAIAIELMRISSIAWPSGNARGCISVIRDIPMLVRLFVIF